MMNRRSRRRSMRKNMSRLFTGFILALVLCMSFGAFFVYAREQSAGDEAVYTYYKSIEIHPGDTLWDIAEETMTDSYDSVAEYVQVIKNMNGLDSDEIHSGQNLIIAYQDTDLH